MPIQFVRSIISIVNVKPETQQAKFKYKTKLIFLPKTFSPNGDVFDSFAMEGRKHIVFNFLDELNRLIGKQSLNCVGNLANDKVNFNSATTFEYNTSYEAQLLVESFAANSDKRKRIENILVTNIAGRQSFSINTTSETLYLNRFGHFDSVFKYGAQIIGGQIQDKFLKGVTPIVKDSNRQHLMDEFVDSRRVQEDYLTLEEATLIISETYKYLVELLVNAGIKPTEANISDLIELIMIAAQTPVFKDKELTEAMSINSGTIEDLVDLIARGLNYNKLCILYYESYYPSDPEEIETLAALPDNMFKELVTS